MRRRVRDVLDWSGVAVLVGSLVLSTPQVSNEDDVLVVALTLIPCTFQDLTDRLKAMRARPSTATNKLLNSLASDAAVCLRLCMSYSCSTEPFKAPGIFRRRQPVIHNATCFSSPPQPRMKARTNLCRGNSVPLRALQKVEAEASLPQRFAISR